MASSAELIRQSCRPPTARPRLDSHVCGAPRWPWGRSGRRRNYPSESIRERVLQPEAPSHGLVQGLCSRPSCDERTQSLVVFQNSIILRKKRLCEEFCP